MIHWTTRKLAARGLTLAALLALAALIQVATPVWAQTPARSSAAPTGAASVFGIDDGGVVSGSQVTTDLAAATGVNWERIALYWSSLEPTEGNYNFSSADNTLNRLLDAGFSLVVYIDQNPTWASNTTCGPLKPGKTQAFANLLYKLVERYPGVRVWAAYNEVDFDNSNITLNTGGCFGARSAYNGDVDNNGNKDYMDYAELLAAGWKAVHDANTATDNDARFAMGALAYDNFNASTAPSGYPGGGSGGLFNYKFAPDLFQYMKNNPLPNNQKYMDLALFNYYNLFGTYYWNKSNPALGFRSKVKALRKLMTQAGIPVVPLFVTETGEDSSPVSDDGVSEKGQARCLTMTLTRGAANKLEGVIWWTFRDHAEPHSNWDYGVVRMDLSKKPSYTALQTLAAELNGYNFEKMLTNKSGFTGVEAYRFGGISGKKYVVWSASATRGANVECSWSRSTKLASFQAQTLRVVNGAGVLNKADVIKVKIIQDGSKKDKNPAAGIIGINVGASPMIVQINP